MTRLGYRPDPFDPRDRTLFARLGLTEPPPRSDELVGHVVDVLDQGATEACVGFAVAQAVRTSFARDGMRPAQLPSPGFIWFNSRVTHGESHLNTGTYLRSAFDTLRKLGFCPEDACPSDHLAWEFSRRPPHRAYQLAHDQRLPFDQDGRGAEYLRITGWESERELQVRQAIAAGRPVVFGTMVAKSFLSQGRHGPLEPPRSYSEIVGGHAMCAVAYDELGIRGPNSWGRFWGNDGWFHMSWAYVRSVMTRDLWAVRTPPRFSR